VVGKDVGGKSIAWRPGKVPRRVGRAHAGEQFTDEVACPSRFITSASARAITEEQRELDEERGLGLVR